MDFHRPRATNNAPCLISSCSKMAQHTIATSRLLASIHRDDGANALCITPVWPGA